MRNNYRMHLQSKCDYVEDEFITFVTFEQWKIFYNADIANWHIVEHEDFCEGFIYDFLECMFDYCMLNKYYDIYYQYPNNEEKHYIKFLRKKDFTKFCKFYKELIKNGLDYENQKEFLELGEIINKESIKKLEETQKKLNEAYNNNIELIEKISKN